MRMIPISIPTPFYVGDVNVYLIREDPITLIDVGPKTDEAEKALAEGLGRHGLSFRDIRRIVLTHSHEDHCGLAKKVRDQAANADVFVHEWETGHLFGRLASEEHRKLLLRSGVPPAVFAQMHGLYEEISLLTDSLARSDLKPLHDEMELEFDGGSLTVLHTPGHTPGSCSFLRAADRTVICGDCVLKRITPNPMLAPDPHDREKRFPSLAEYLVSLARLRSLSPTLAYGGHGESVSDFEEIFNRYVRAIDERQRRVVGLVPSGGITAYELAKGLFPDAVDNDVHRFLAISEAIAHLDYAHGQARVGLEISDGVEIYKPA
ncbi:MAG: Zn-dependent hydrolase [Acidobacteria bacterium OLB17]|nr:MAG: Zn-dependent hydrolase [Acidobacteria bacterium OLB17]MCZ2391118.1 MBL fold metallo-hydrolase [Acidobacteriota bacterium]